MAGGQTVLEKMATDKTSGASKKDLHVDSSCAV